MAHKRVPKILARKLAVSSFLEKGEKRTRQMYGVGAGMALPGIMWHIPSMEYGAAGIGLMALSGPLNTLSKKYGEPVRVKTMLRLIGKPHLARNTALASRNPAIRSILHTIAGARTPSEREAVKKFVVEGELTAKDTKLLISITRRALTAEKTTELRTTHTFFKNLLGISQRKLDEVAIRVANEVAKGDILNNLELYERIGKLILPHVISEARFKFGITTPRFGNRVLSAISTQENKVYWLVRFGQETSYQAIVNDAKTRASGKELYNVLEETFGTKKNMARFMNYLAQSRNEIAQYTFQRMGLILTEKGLGAQLQALVNG